MSWGFAGMLCLLCHNLEHVMHAAWIPHSASLTIVACRAGKSTLLNMLTGFLEPTDGATPLAARE